MSNAVEKMEEPERRPVQRSDNMVSMLERVLLDTTLPVERLERLLEIHNSERQREAKVVWSQRMSEAQAKMHAVLVNKDNRQTSSKYASYDALDAAVRPIYTEHGFSVTYNTEPSGEAGMIRVVAFVENSGFERRYEIDMPCDGKGAKGNDVMTKTHAVKSAVTYGKTTLLPMIFNLAVTTDRSDDDGNAAGGSVPPPLLTEDQVIELRDFLHARDLDERKFCERIKVASLSDILASKFEDAKRLISSTGARR